MLAFHAPDPLKKVVENPFGIHRAWCSFRMKLHREKGKLSMLHAFIAAIIGIDKPGVEGGWQNTDGKAMILCGDIAALRVMQETGLVLTPVAKFQLIGITAGGKCQQLMAQANAKGRYLALKGCLNGLDRFLDHFRIAGPIGYDDGI